jgi:Alpha/beta hydrolase family
MTSSSAVTSADGSRIAYSRAGSGPALVLVDGALCHRGMGLAAKIARALAPHFTVYTYDRRGRGESGDTPPYAPAREVEDLAAIVGEAGGRAALVGLSSGGVLALDAATSIDGVTAVVSYEAPVVVEPDGNVTPAGFRDDLQALVDAGRRGVAVSRFMRLVGMPRPAIAAMHLLPVWRRLTAVAHTLPYDFTLLGDLGSGRPLPPERWAGVAAPVLSLAGGKSPAWMRTGAQALAAAVPHGTEGTLPGQTHMVKADALAPVVVEFLARRPAAV